MSSLRLLRIISSICRTEMIAVCNSFLSDLTSKILCFLLQALTVLEYLVANGTERVIDEIREHAYQISVNFDSLKLRVFSFQ